MDIEKNNLKKRINQLKVALFTEFSSKTCHYYHAMMFTIYACDQAWVSTLSKYNRDRVEHMYEIALHSADLRQVKAATKAYIRKRVKFDREASSEFLLDLISWLRCVQKISSMADPSMKNY